MRRASALVAGLALGLAACSGTKAPPAEAPPPPPPPPPPPVTTATVASAPGWTTGAWPAHLPREAYAVAVATSTDADAALRMARAALEMRVLGPASERPFAALPSALAPLADPALEARHAQEGRTSVLVATARAAASAKLEAWAAELEPDSALPERTDKGEKVLVSGRDVQNPQAHLQALIDHTRYRRAARFACTVAPVRTSTCAAPNPQIMEAGLSSFLSEVQVRPVPADGVPRHPRAGALRPLTVRVDWTSPGSPAKPLPGIPVVVDAWGQRQIGKSDARGLVQVPVPADASPEAAATVHVDAQARLTELADLWSAPPTTQVILRTLDLAHTRVGLLVLEASAGQSTQDGSEALRTRLSAAGLGSVFYLDASFAPPRPPEPTALRALADQAEGRLDVLIVGTFDSHFASQMGARSVWYEATGQLELFDVWTGRRIGTVEDTARAVAIGEAAAAQAAIRQLGARSAEKVQQALQNYAPPTMALY